MSITLHVEKIFYNPLKFCLLVYYPTASRDEEILVHLLLQKATKSENAAYLSEGRVVEDLAEAEYVDKIGGGFYLTGDGAYIAKGALELYSELDGMSAEIPQQDSVELTQAS